LPVVSKSDMTFRKWAVRIVWLAGGLVVLVVLVAFLAIQIQQRTLRWRAERLSADMHTIRLYQSTWGRCAAADAPLGSVGPLRR
jgi:H+/Cl- antiporter ClcA